MAKIALVTLRYGDLPYFQFSDAINRAYCARHGYDWLVTYPDSELLPDRDRMWYKILRVAEALRDREFVVFLDADAWVHDWSRSVEQLITEQMGPALFLFGTDRRSTAIGWSDTRANSGVYVARNHPLAFHILNEWWHVPLYDPKMGFGWPLEQWGLNVHIHPRWQRGGWIKLISHYHLNGLDGRFIRHAVDVPDPRRTEILREAFELLVQREEPLWHT